MSLTNPDRVAQTRTQLRAVRTEVEVAADVLARLFDSGILTTTPRMVAQVCETVGVPVDALRAAKTRRERRPYVAPFDTAAITHVSTKGFTDELQARRGAAGQANAARLGGAVTSKQPPVDAMEYRCASCRESKPIAEFPHRADHPERRWTTCNECRRARSRRYYLNTAKAQAMEKARVTFTVGPEGVGLACADCGGLFVARDRVWGDTQIRHVACPKDAS